MVPPILPGVFQKEIFDELCISRNAFTGIIGVSPMRISHIVKGTRPVTPFRQGLRSDSQLLDDPTDSP